MILSINSQKFKVRIVSSYKDTKNGMMKKKFNDEFNGMLFLMGDGTHSFWMKNCIIALDIIYIKDNKITKIHNNCPPCDTDDCDHYPGTGNLVLELKGGTCEDSDISVGDSIKFEW